MFNIGFNELLVVLVVAFLVVGPKDLPRVARWIARQIKVIKRLIREIKEETGWNEIMADINDVKADVKETVKEVDIRSDLKEAENELKKGTKSIETELRTAAKEGNAEYKK